MKGALNFLGGPALTSQYLVVVTPPTAMLSEGALGILGGVLAVGGTLNLALMATSASLPGRSLQTQDAAMFGTMRKMPVGVIYDSITLTFICTNSMTERAFFDAWHQFIINPETSYMSYWKDYTAPIVIKKLQGSGLLDSALAMPLGGTQPEDSLAGDPTFNSGSLNPPQVELAGLLSTYYIDEAWPVRIGSQELSYDETSIVKLEVEFYYRRWRSAIDLIFPNLSSRTRPSSLGDLV
jgi:hypothetical protein